MYVVADDMSSQFRAGMERHVETLPGTGGPAVDVCNMFFGFEKQQKYIRTVCLALTAELFRGRHPDS